MTQVAPASPSARQSRVGKKPVALPKGVTVSVSGGVLRVQGPKGALERRLPATVSIRVEGGIARVASDAPGGDAARLQGLVWSLLLGMVKGVADGYTRTLELKGTGYRAEVKGGAVHLALGFSHPVVHPLPAGITCTIPPESKGTMLILHGPDKEAMGSTCAQLRAYRPPEPYAGKGVRYQGERVREKAGKAGKAGAAGAATK